MGGGGKQLNIRPPNPKNEGGVSSHPPRIDALAELSRHKVFDVRLDTVLRSLQCRTQLYGSAHETTET